MGAFAAFIESEAFFPVLILLLLILMFTFVFILMFGRNSAKKEMLGRKNIQIDESAQVQLVQHGAPTEFKNEVIDDYEEETGSNEVVLIEEVEAVDLSEVESMNDIDNNVENKEYLNESEIEIPNVIEQSVDDIVIEETETNIPSLKEKTNDIKEVVMENEVSAFNLSANENHTINTEVKVDMPKEYDDDKTEILEFPDFDLFDDDATKKIETQIINQANKYIESVMESRDNRE